MNRTLLILDAEGEETRFDMTQETLLVGRDPSADLTLRDDRVSREHVRLTQVSGDVIVEELGSSNGTLLNGVPFEGKRILQEGDALGLGSMEIHIDRVGKRTVRRGVSESTPDKSTTPRPKQSSSSGLPMVLVALTLVAAVVYMVKESSTETNASKSGNAGTEVAEETENAVVETPRTTSRAGNPAVRPSRRENRFLTDRALADARSELRLMIEESILADDLRSAADAIEEFESANGRRSARTSRTQFDSAVEALLNRSLTEWQALSQAMTPAEAAVWLHQKSRAFPIDSPKLKKLQVAVTKSLQGLSASKRTAELARAAAETRAANPTDSGSSAGSAVNEVTPRSSYEVLVREAKTAESRRKYAVASETWGRAALAARAESRGKQIERTARRKVRRLTLQSKGLQAIARHVNADSAGFKGLRCLATRRGDAVKASDAGVEVLLDKNKLTLSWKAVRDDFLKDLIRRCKLQGEDEQLGCAQLLLAIGDDDGGHKLLKTALEDDGGLHPEIAELLSDHLGMDRPKGAFCWIEGRFLSPREAHRVATRTSIQSLAADLADAEASVRRSAAEKLFALGASAQSLFHRTLMDQKLAFLGSLEETKTYARLKQMGKQAASLRTQRESVLDLVFDTHLYPSPYRGVGQEIRRRYQETQQKIDELKVGVRDIWNSGTTVRVGPKFRAQLSRISELNSWLEKLELGRGGSDPEFLLYLPATDTVTIRTFALDPQGRSRIDDSIVAMAENAKGESAASNGEQRQVEITNEYRLMMGRHAVRIHDILTRSVRGHCEDMARLGFFSHINEKEPEKRTPSDRARLMGFNGGVSENIAINSGALSVHNAWIHSSGHHRNILGMTHRIMGAGNAGKRWGQVFSQMELESLVVDDSEDEETKDNDTDS